MGEKNQDTEQKILAAATEIFQKKGYAGTRMQDIADLAEINRAMLHYYYRNKEKLFNGILSNAIANIIPQLNEITASSLPIFEKIEVFVDKYITLISETPDLPLFLLHEVHQNQEKFFEIFFSHSKGSMPDPYTFMNQLQEEANAGKIRPIEPKQLIINLLSLCIFPFINKPIFQKVFHMNEQEYQKFLESRKKDVAQFIINSIKL